MVLLCPRGALLSSAHRTVAAVVAVVLWLLRWLLASGSGFVGLLAFLCHWRAGAPPPETLFPLYFTYYRGIRGMWYVGKRMHTWGCPLPD